MERLNRWRLFYLDFVETDAIQQFIMQYSELTSFTPSSDM